MLARVHAGCDAGRKSDFVRILSKLQQRYAGRRMPQHCHGWSTLDELCSMAGASNPPADLSHDLLDTHSQPEGSLLDESGDESGDDSGDESVDDKADGDGRKQSRARVRKRSSARSSLVDRFGTAEGRPAPSEQEQSDDPDVQPAPARRRARRPHPHL